MSLGTGKTIAPPDISPGDISSSSYFRIPARRKLNVGTCTLSARQKASHRHDACPGEAATPPELFCLFHEEPQLITASGRYCCRKHKFRTQPSRRSRFGEPQFRHHRLCSTALHPVVHVLVLWVVAGKMVTFRTRPGLTQEQETGRWSLLR